MQKELKKKKEEEEKVMNMQEKAMLREEWEKQTELAKLKELQQINRQK